MKRVFIIHGWEGYPEEGWLPWLKNELENKGFEVFVPSMPNADEPKINEWVSHIAGIVGDADKDTYFVGHSIGCQAIIRYLQTIDAQVGGCVFVAGFFELTNLEGPDEEKIAEPWIITPIDLSRVKRAMGRAVSIFSDNDPFVPKSNWEKFEQSLGAETIILNNMQHFSGSEGITELPQALESILKMAV